MVVARYARAGVEVKKGGSYPSDFKSAMKELVLKDGGVGEALRIKQNAEGQFPGRRVLYKWKKEAKEEKEAWEGPRDTFTPGPGRGKGRPKTVSPKVEACLAEELDEAAGADKPPLEKDGMLFARAALEKKGIFASDSTIRNVLGAMDLRDRLADNRAAARRRAALDPRNVIALIIMLFALRTPGVADDPSHVWNFDATVIQTLSEADRAKKEKVLVRKEFLEKNDKRCGSRRTPPAASASRCSLAATPWGTRCPA